MNTIALCWGFLEATLFFIVPDVYLSYLSVIGARKAAKASFWALMGALLGGVVIYLAAINYAEYLIQIFNKIPGIYPELQIRVKQHLTEQGLLAVFIGPTQGLPYKLYACYSAILDLNIGAFLLVSVPARLLRFWGSILLFSLIKKALEQFLKTRSILAIMGLIWMAFYIFYFIHI